MGFWSINVDSMAWSVGLGLVFTFFFRKAAAYATAGVPGGLQNFCRNDCRIHQRDYSKHLSAQERLHCALGDDDFCLGVSDECHGLSAGRLDSRAGGVARRVPHEGCAVNGSKHHHGHGTHGFHDDSLLQH